MGGQNEGDAKSQVSSSGTDDWQYGRLCLSLWHARHVWSGAPSTSRIVILERGEGDHARDRCCQMLPLRCDMRRCTARQSSSSSWPVVSRVLLCAVQFPSQIHVGVCPAADRPVLIHISILWSLCAICSLLGCLMLKAWCFKTNNLSFIS